MSQPSSAAATGGDGELVLYLGLGQSLLARVPRRRPLGEGPGPVDLTRAWVLAETGDPRLAANPMLDLPETALASHFPHLRYGRSGPLTAASAEILSGLGANDRLLTVNLARRGTPLAAFGRGTASFRNVERCLRRAAEIAQAEGLKFERLVVSWVQGQADVRTPRRLYSDVLLQLIDDLEAALLAVTGRRGGLVFCISQVTAISGAERRGAALAQLDVAEARPDQVIVAGPDYMLERSDGVHLKPKSAVYLGVLHGRAIRRMLAGEGWEPLRVADATVLGNQITVSMAGGIGDLVADADQTAPQAGESVAIGARRVPHLGFSWKGPPGDATGIAEARISGARQVTLTLTGTPAAPERARLLLGFPPGIGAPEGFVSGDPETARGAATRLRTAGEGRVILGMPLQDWALQQMIVPRPAGPG